MNTQYITEEWKADKDEVIIDKDLLFIAHCDSGQIDRAEKIATLIASAPELLDACINAARTLVSIGTTIDAPIMQDLMRAIKKAKGE